MSVEFLPHPIALAGFLLTPEKIRDVAALPQMPVVEEINVIPDPVFDLPININDQGLTCFCCVNLEVFV